MDEAELYKELGALTKEKDRWKESIPYVSALLTHDSVKIQAKALWLLGEMGLAYHYDDERSIFVADVIVYAPCRGVGYGSRGLDLLCDAAKKNGVALLYDDIAIENPAITLFLKHGFVEEYRTDEIIMLKKEL